jgi:hypothetical protein
MIKYQPGEPIAYVSIYDSAVNYTECQHEKFAETLDLQYRPLKEGVKPTLYRLAGLKRAQDNEVRRAPPHERTQVCVAFGLRGIENAEDANGHPIVLKTKKAGLAGDRLDDSTLDKIYSPELFDELAMIIERLTKLDPLSVSR